MRKTLLAGAAVLALSFGVVACGSDDSGDSSDEALTNTELIAQADQICSDYNDQLTTIQEDSGLSADSSQDEKISFISDDIVPLYRDQVDELRALTPSDEDADAYADVVDTLESNLDDVESDPEAALAADNPFADATAKANDFGLEVCGSN